MTDGHSRRLLAVVIAVVVTFSMTVPFAGTAAAGQQAGQNSIVAETSGPVEQSANPDQPGAAIDPALKRADGTVEVVVRLGKADVPMTASRQVTVQSLKSHAQQAQRPVLRFAKTEADGVKVLNRLWIANAVLLEVDKSEVSLKKVAHIEGVKRLHANFELSLPKPVKAGSEGGEVGTHGADSDADEYDTTYGIEQINATKVWSEYDTMGQGVKVAVLDTGVDIDHPDIDLYTTDPGNETYPGGWAEFDSNGNRVPGSVPHDSAQHGTHTSGTVSGGDASGEYIGVAPKVSLMHGLVIPGGGGTFTQVAAGMQWAAANGADVVSMSLGATGYHAAMIEPTQNIEAAGAILVASAGNSYEGSSGSPGNVYDAVAIGASNENLGIAPFSSGEVVDTSADWGAAAPAHWPETYVVPDVSAPGVAVKSSVPDGGYAEFSGTSMAAPHTAGAIALMLSAADGDLSNAQVKNALFETAFKPEECSPSCNPRSGNDTRYGAGIIDVYNATTRVASVAPEYELGDVNENGDVNVQDIRLMQQYLYGGEPESFNENLADMNRDGEVTIADLNLLQRKVQSTLDEGSIQVSNLSAPEEVEGTETFTVTVDLENPGDEGAIQEIALYVAENESALGEGEPIETEVVDMAPAGVDDPVDRPHETTVTFEVDAADLGAGDYHIGVFSEDDSATGEITILGSNFEVPNLSAPAEVEQGNAFDVTATVTNTGNKADTQTVEYRFGGTVERTTNVTLGAGESTTVSFEDIETNGVSAGTYEHGMYTEDDSMTANITVLEAFFDVEITDAPSKVTVGETINVTATVENTGNATDEQTVTYDLAEAETTVAVVDSGEGYGDQVVATLREELPDQYNVTLVEDQNAMEAVGEYDVFVMQDLDPAELDVQAFVEATSGQQTGVVWLDGWGSGSDAIPELSAATGNPDSTADADDGSTPVSFTVTQAHPIFEGVATPGDTVPVHNADYADRSWFTGYSGQVIATVGAQGTNQGGPAVAVDSANATVLASSLGRELFVQNPDFTEAANQTLANSVSWASGSGSLGATGVTAQDDTSQNVTLAPGESATVAFTYTVPDGTDISADWLHTVTSEDDVDTAPVTIDIDRGAVEGTVTDAATGDSIEGATVNVSVAADDGDYTAVTGADGTYRIEDVPAGTHNVTATLDGYTNVTKTVDVPANDTTTVNFALIPMDGSISGTVTASDTGEPVSNVTVAAEDNDGNVYEATTGANGTYTLDVPPGNYVVNVADTPGDYRPQEIVTVAPGETVTGVDFTVEPRDGSIAGYVKNAAGEPIAGAHVVDADQGKFNVTTNESGYYEITGLDRGMYALRAKADGYNATDITFVEVAANETTTQNFTLGSFFAVSNLTAPATAEQGETINVSATITNDGTEQATRTVFYFPPGTDFGGSMLAAQSDLFERVTLDGGESTTVTFIYQIAESREPGEYRHGVSADEIESTLITIEESQSPAEANFSVSDLSAPAEAAPGAEITVSATVTNTGNATGTQTVEYLFNGTTANSTEVTLAPGESTAVEFTPTMPATERTYQHGIETVNDQALADIVVESGEPEPTYFAVSNLTGPSEAEQGEEITVTATITNTGDEQGTQSIYFFFMEASSANQHDLAEFGTREMLERFRPQTAPHQVTLDGGESTTVTFTHTVSESAEPGEYQYAVSSLQEVTTHPLTVTAANGNGQANVPPAPVFWNSLPPAPVFHNGVPPAPVFADERADDSGRQHSVRGVAVMAG